MKIPNEGLIVDEATGLRVFRATSSPEIYGTKAVYLAFGTRRPAHQETTEFFTFRVMTREVTDSDFPTLRGHSQHQRAFQRFKGGGDGDEDSSKYCLEAEETTS